MHCSQRELLFYFLSGFVFFSIFICPNFLFSQAVYHGTTIVVLKTKDSIIVGADSKLSSMQAFTFGNPTPFPVGRIDKIRIAGNMAYVIAQTALFW